VRLHTLPLQTCHKARAYNREALRVTKPVGRVLLEVREAAGIPRSELARKAKLDPSVVWRLENPKAGAQPSFDLISKVAAALGVSLDDISARTESVTARHDVPTARDQLDRILEAVEHLRDAYAESLLVVVPMARQKPGPKTEVAEQCQVERACRITLPDLTARGASRRRYASSGVA